MRYQTYSTFTELKRNKENLENEVNNQEISHQLFGNDILFVSLGAISLLFGHF